MRFILKGIPEADAAVGLAGSCEVNYCDQNPRFELIKRTGRHSETRRLCAVHFADLIASNDYWGCRFDVVR